MVPPNVNDDAESLHQLQPKTAFRVGQTKKPDDQHPWLSRVGDFSECARRVSDRRMNCHINLSSKRPAELKAKWMAKFRFQVGSLDKGL
jgi:hypothetical protein